MRPDLIALLNAVIGHLTGLDTHELGDLTEGTTPEVAEHLVLLDKIIATARILRGAVETDLTARMDEDEMLSPTGIPIVREWMKPKLVWDRDYVNRQIDAKVADKVAFDISTGQVVPAYRHVALEAITWLRNTYGDSIEPLSGRGSGIRQLGLDPQDFRHSEGDGRYRIKDTAR